MRQVAAVDRYIKKGLNLQLLATLTKSLNNYLHYFEDIYSYLTYLPGWTGVQDLHHLILFPFCLSCKTKQRNCAKNHRKERRRETTTALVHQGIPFIEGYFGIYIPAGTQMAWFGCIYFRTYMARREGHRSFPVRILPVTVFASIKEGGDLCLDIYTSLQ